MFHLFLAKAWLLILVVTSGHQENTTSVVGVAVCLIGRLRALSRTLHPLKKKLLAALQEEHLVDVFVYAPSPTAPEIKRLAHLFDLPVLVRAVRFDDEEHILESLARSQRSILKSAMRIRGNWLGSAMKELLPGSRDRRSGTGLFQMFAQSQCLDMILARERRRGTAYERVVVTRTDLLWLFPHPPLALLSSEYAWVPDTSEDDWGGFYDRHFVIPRSVADVVLGGWDNLLAGRAYHIITQLVGSAALRGNNTNTEVWFMLRLMSSGIRVARFPMTAYIACDVSEWSSSILSSEAPVRTGSRAAIHGAVHGFECSADRDYRYPLEHAAVAGYAECLAGHEAGQEAGHEASLAQLWRHSQIQKCYCWHYDLQVFEEYPDNFVLCQS